MSEVKQATLDGRPIPVVPPRKDSHVYISPRTDHVLVMAKQFKFITRGNFVDICTAAGAVLSKFIPADVFKAIKDMKEDEILKVLVTHLSEYLKEEPD